MPKARQKKQQLEPTVVLIQDVVANRSVQLAQAKQIQANELHPSEESLRECLKQSHENSRAYMDLRFKHFGTFVVVTGLLGTAGFQVTKLAAIQGAIALLALVVTSLFWLLDYRTSQLMLDERMNIKKYRTLLSLPEARIQKHRVLLRASHATNLIFLSIEVLWLMIYLNSR